MFKTNISYTDLNGINATETLYFNLTTVEIARLGAKISPEDGDLAGHFQKVASSGNALNNILLMTEVVLAAYGQPTPDGRGFQKNPALVQQFEYSIAFAEFIEQLMYNAPLAEEFGRNVLAVNPDLVQKAEQAQLTVPYAQAPTASNVLQMGNNVGNTPIVDKSADMSVAIQNIMSNDGIPFETKQVLINQLTKG
jgi:hypothetical protein